VVVTEDIGFYNTFTASQPAASPYECATLDDGTEELVAVRSRNFIGYQFHPESILTKNGQAILSRSIDHLLLERSGVSAEKYFSSSFQ
jgi:phenazine biosynthesis protein phzE